MGRDKLCRLKIEFLPVLGVKDENEKSAIPLVLKLRALGAKGL